MRQNGPKMPIFGQKRQFCAKTPFFGVDGVKHLVPSYQGTNESPFCVKTIDRCGSNSPLGTKMCNFDPKFWGQKLIFFWNCGFCQQGISPINQGLQLSHLDHPEKYISFQAMDNFLGLTPVFGRFGPFPPRYYKYP